MEIEIEVPKVTNDELRRRREKECFSIINRGQLWYDCLSFEQKGELNSWYHAWLNVTETHIVPNPPTWINDKIEREEIRL